jgi:hypothetical protein
MRCSSSFCREEPSGRAEPRSKRALPALILLLALSFAANGCFTRDHLIGPVETVELLSKDSQDRVKVKAKIDTGAYSSSIDERLASRLGFGDAIRYYKGFGLSGTLTREEVGELRAKGIKEKLAKHPDIVEAVFVYSSTGITLRIKIPLTFYLAGVRISSPVTVADRRNLKYPMIIGRRDLKGFLIDPDRK